MKIILTGASGYIGSQLNKILLSNDYQVIPLSHNLPFEKIVALFQEEKPELVIHLASLFIPEHASSDVDALIQGNILFGTQILEAMRLSGTHAILNTGTSWQHYSEDGTTSSSLYAATKTAFEQILRFYHSSEHISVLTLKIYDTYGPNDPRPKLIPKLLQMCCDQSGQTKLSLSKGEQLLNFVHIEDVLQAYLLAIEELKNKPCQFKNYFLRAPEEISLKNLISLVERLSKSRLNVDLGSRPYRKREVMKPWSQGDLLSNWQPKRRLGEGLKELIDAHK
jgi:nucleoside-diphosphate-sugar epimerase